MSSVLNRRILRRQFWQVRKKQKADQKKIFDSVCETTGDDEYDLGINGNMYWFKIIYMQKH